MPTELIFPTQLWPDEETVTLEDQGTNVFQPIMGAAVTQRTQGSEPKMVVKQTYRTLRTDHRAQLLAFTRAVQGSFKSFWLSPARFTNIGSWTPVEVFSNGTFSGGTAAWSGQNAVLTAVPGGVRIRNTKASGTLNFAIHQPAGVSTTGIYSLRGFVAPMNHAYANSSYNGVWWQQYQTPNSYAYGLYGMYEKTALASSGGTNWAYPAIIDTNGNVTRANDYADIYYASLAQALLVDVEQNLLKNSTNTASNWGFITNVNVTNNAVAGPEGRTTAFLMAETNVTSPLAGHGVGQQITVSSAALDYAFSASFKVGSHATKAQVYLEETQGLTQAAAQLEFATGSIATSFGAGWTHGRTYVQSEGNGWWRVAVAARKVSSANALTAYLFMSNSAGTFNYASTGSGFIYAADASLAQSSVPVGYTATTTAAYAGITTMTDLVQLKGGPVNVRGAMRAGQLVQIGGELKTIVHDVDFDGLGLGIARIRPTLFRVPAADDAVHVSRPFGRFVLRNAAEVINRLGQYADVTLEMEEVYE